MSIARKKPGVASWNNRLYVFGGYTSTAEYYDPLTNKWITITDMIEAINELYVCVSNDMIYVMGSNSFGQAGISVQVYDPKLNVWNEVRFYSIKTVTITI